MKKRILACLLCACAALAGFAASSADGRLDGDANRDGRVTAADAAYILRYVSGTDDRMDLDAMLSADVNGNGRIEESDASAILRDVVDLAPLDPKGTDAQTLSLLNRQSLLYSDEMTEWTARFLFGMPSGDVRKVLYEGAKLLGTPYGTGEGQLDCSAFVAAAYKNAGIPKSKYPRSYSDGTLNWYRTNHPEKLHETDEYSREDWTPGSVLIYVNDSTGKGSHLALYVGEICGYPVVMESRRSGCDGVRIGYLMGSSASWDLCWYVDPLI